MSLDRLKVAKKHSFPVSTDWEVARYMSVPGTFHIRTVWTLPS